MRLFLGATLLFCLAAPASADDTSPVMLARLSAQLYATGLAEDDPILILTAARLRKALAPVGSNRSDLAGTVEEGTPLTWQEMLSQAEPHAVGNDDLVALIADVKAETMKGVVAGPVYNISALGTGGGDTYPPIAFRGGEYAEVYVEARAATDLNLTIYDGQGRLVCSDTDISFIAYCGWTPAEAGDFTFKVHNKGPVAAQYALMTN